MKETLLIQTPLYFPKQNRLQAAQYSTAAAKPALRVANTPCDHNSNQNAACSIIYVLIRVLPGRTALNVSDISPGASQYTLPSLCLNPFALEMIICHTWQCSSSSHSVPSYQRTLNGLSACKSRHETQMHDGCLIAKPCPGTAEVGPQLPELLQQSRRFLLQQAGWMSDQPSHAMLLPQSGCLLLQWLFYTPYRCMSDMLMKCG